MALARSLGLLVWVVLGRMLIMLFLIGPGIRWMALGRMVYDTSVTEV